MKIAIVFLISLLTHSVGFSQVEEDPNIKSFEAFNSVMEEFNEAYTSTDEEKEQVKILKKYESIIEKAEKQLEKELEDNYQKQLDQLKKEEEESAPKEDVDLDKEEREKEFLVEEATNASFIARRYYNDRDDRNGFSTKQIAKIFEVSDDGKESETSSRIYDRILAIRKERNK